MLNIIKNIVCDIVVMNTANALAKNLVSFQSDPVYPSVTSAMDKPLAFLFCVMILIALLANPTEARRKSRLNCA